MAARKKNKRFFTFRIELGILGMLGVGVVCFCIFLWVFLLGVWSGQTVLLPSKPGKGPDMLTRLAADLWQKGKETIREGFVPPSSEQTGATDVGKDMPMASGISVEGQGEPSCFSLQVGSFRDKKKAQRDVLGWKAKGQDAFYLPPEEGADAFRVFVGRFEKLADANEVATRLESEEDARVYVTLLPSSKFSAGKVD